MDELIDVKSECDIEIKEEILESNSLKENFGRISEEKSEFSEPNSQELRYKDCTGHSQKVQQNHFVMSEFKPIPNGNHMNQELKKCPICDATFSRQMQRIAVKKHIKNCKIEYKVIRRKESVPIEFTTEIDKQVQIEKPKMKVKGVEIYKYVKGKRDQTPIYQTKKSKYVHYSPKQNYFVVCTCASYK
jgi:hypothetical protein